jgi:hypothetical protein
VKSNIRILIVALLTTAYGFETGVVTKSLAHSHFRDYSTSSQEKTFSDFSKKLFCHTSQTESSVNSFNNLPAPKFQNPFKEFWANTQVTEQLIETAFSQYSHMSRNFLIQHRKEDIIFPFHYFW